MFYFTVTLIDTDYTKSLQYSEFSGNPAFYSRSATTTKANDSSYVIIPVTEIMLIVSIVLTITMKLLTKIYTIRLL